MLSVKTEPVAISGAIMGVGTASFAVALSFGAPLTTEQVGYLLGLLSAIIVLVTVWQRSKVRPVDLPTEDES